MREPRALRSHDDADADRHRQCFRAAQITELARGIQDRGADLAGRRQRRLRQDHGKAIAGDAAYECLRTGGLLHEPAHEANDLVAGAETERLVDRRDLVDVDVEHGRGPGVERPLGAAFEDETIREAREGVVFALENRDCLAADELEDAHVLLAEILGATGAK